MLYSVLLTVDVLLAIGLIVLVLLQHGKGADAGAAFGSGASATVFGSRGSASFLSRATAVFATLFFANSLALAFIVSHQPADRSITEQLANEPASPAVPNEGSVQEDAVPERAQDSPAADDVPVPDAPAAGEQVPDAEPGLASPGDSSQPEDVPR